MNPEECWDLASLCPSEKQWEKSLKQWEKMIGGYARFKGKLGRSARMLADCMKFDAEICTGRPRAGYAFLKESEDQGNSDAVRMKGRATHLATQTNEAAAYAPEILAIPQGKLKKMLKSPTPKEWQLAIERIARYKPHTLDDGREKLLAMQGKMSDAARPGCSASSMTPT